MQKKYTFPACQTGKTAQNEAAGGEIPRNTPSLYRFFFSTGCLGKEDRQYAKNIRQEAGGRRAGRPVYYPQGPALSLPEAGGAL